jgi:hypothetical protein
VGFHYPRARRRQCNFAGQAPGANDAPRHPIQWSGGGGATNGIGGFNGDLDTIDAIRLP